MTKNEMYMAFAVSAFLGLVLGYFTGSSGNDYYRVIMADGTAMMMSSSNAQEVLDEQKRVSILIALKITKETSDGVREIMDRETAGFSEDTKKVVMSGVTMLGDAIDALIEENER